MNFQPTELHKIILTFIVMIVLAAPLHTVAEETEFDIRVRQFLEVHRGQWRDSNVPWVDGQVLHDLIVENNFQRALEIGTSTGHSGIWIAWALSKTGGKLITVEINEGRHRQALKNFEAAGLSEYIDARLADAHELVYELDGSFDFIFSDADKQWYKKYLEALLPKLRVGGCFTAHNVRYLRVNGIKEFLDYAYAQPDLSTTIDKSSNTGISISCKKRKEDIAKPRGQRSSTVRALLLVVMPPLPSAH